MGSPLGPLMTNALMPPWGIASFAAVFGCHATLPGALRDIQKTVAKTTWGIVADSGGGGGFYDCPSNSHVSIERIISSCP